MGKEVMNVSVDILKIHPRNAEFFDDISGDEYERFKKSIQEDGILSPILVSPDMTIISGHQRTKALRELGIKLVPIIIREDLIEDNEKLKVLLAANFGRTKNDPIKQRKVAVEYVNLCGNTHGGSRDDCRLLTLKEIASQLNTSETSLKELLAIERKLTPEVKQLLDDGIFTKRVASKVLVKLSQEEQEELIAQLDITKKYTQKQVEEYVDKLKITENENNVLSQKLSQLDNLEDEISKLKTELDNRPEKEIETLPLDYHSTKKELEEYKSNYRRLNNEYANKVKELQEVRQQIKTITEQSPQEQFNKKLKDSTLLFCSKVATFIEQVGGYVWLTDHINELPDLERTGYIKAINEIKNWSNTMDYNINNNTKEIR